MLEYHEPLVYTDPTLSDHLVRGSSLDSNNYLSGLRLTQAIILGDCGLHSEPLIADCLSPDDFPQVLF